MIDPKFPSGAVIIPAADGHENREFEQRLAQQLSLIEHGSLEHERLKLLAEIDALRDEMRMARRLASRSKFGRLFEKIWHGWCLVMGGIGIALPISVYVVYVFSGNDDIVRALGKPIVQSDVVHPGGALIFTQDVERLESCPGDVVEVYAPVGIERNSMTSTTILRQHRPAQNITPGRYLDTKQITQVPYEIKPGLWRYEWSVDSRCPLRTKLETIASFNIKVEP